MTVRVRVSELYSGFGTYWLDTYAQPKNYAGTWITQNNFMANLKKEVQALITRFDAAQEAFKASSTEAKAIRKQHKKELKAKNKTIKELRQEIENLLAEMRALKARKVAKVEPIGQAKADVTPPAAKSKPKAASKPAPKAATKTRRKKTSRPKSSATKSELLRVRGIGPSVAAAFDAVGITTPAQLSEASNEKIVAALQEAGPRYRNPTPDTIQNFRDAAREAK